MFILFAPRMKHRHFKPIFLTVLLILTTPCWSSELTSEQLNVDGKVLELDESNLEAAISTFDYLFVDFYAPWCGHCKRLSPELDKAAPLLTGLKKPIVIAKVNADKYKSLTSKYEIDGFPTLMVFMHGVPTEYYGPRKADQLAQSLKKFVAPNIAILNSDSAVREFVEEAGSQFPIFLGFGVEESMIADLAVKYKKKAWFSVIKDVSEELMAFYDFDKVPALVALHPRYTEQSIFYGPFEEKFLEDYITQSLLPLVLPINDENLRLLKDDKRKVVLTIMEDDTDEKSRELIKVLKAAASANRDFVFGYVGVKQFEEFTESFEVDESTQLPKMIVWDGKEEYSSVNGSERIDEADQGSQITRFLEGYREGNVIQHRISGPSLTGFIKSVFGGMRAVYMLVFVVALFCLIIALTKEEPSVPSGGARENADLTQRLTSPSESSNRHRSGDKEDKED